MIDSPAKCPPIPQFNNDVLALNSAHSVAQITHSCEVFAPATENNIPLNGMVHQSMILDSERVHQISSADSAAQTSDEGEIFDITTLNFAQLADSPNDTLRHNISPRSDYEANDIQSTFEPIAFTDEDNSTFNETEQEISINTVAIEELDPIVLEEQKPSNLFDAPMIEQDDELPPVIEEPASNVLPSIYSGSPPTAKKQKISSPRKENYSLSPVALGALKQDVETDPEMEIRIERIQKKKEFPAFPDQAPLLHYIHRQKVNAIVEGDYDKAEDLEETARKISNVMHCSNDSSFFDQRLKAAEERLEAAKNELYIMNKKWNERMVQEEELFKKSVYLLDDQQENELKQFETKWNSEEWLRKYSKPSAKLLQYRSIERSMAIAKMYSEAKTIRSRASIVENSESHEQQRRANLDMSIERKKLMEKHEQELNTKKDHYEKHLGILQRQRDQETNPIINKLNSIQQEINKIKRAQENPIHVQKVSAVDLDECPTPRTSYRLASYKISSRQSPKLRIKPLGTVSDVARKGRGKRIRSLTHHKK